MRLRGGLAALIIGLFPAPPAGAGPGPAVSGDPPPAQPLAAGLAAPSPPDSPGGPGHPGRTRALRPVLVLTALGRPVASPGRDGCRVDPANTGEPGAAGRRGPRRRRASASGWRTATWCRRRPTPVRSSSEACVPTSTSRRPRVRGGHGPMESLERAVEICQGWVFDHVRGALLRGEPPTLPRRGTS